MTLEGFEQATLPILNQVSTMTLATCHEGLPWATDVYFAADGFDFIFFSSPTSRHCQNLSANPACAATIHPIAHAWGEIRGLQIEGIAAPIATMGGKARGLATYLLKFPFARELLSHPSKTVHNFNHATLYELRPSRILYLDNSLGFGTRYCVNIIDGRVNGLPARDKGV